MPKLSFSQYLSALKSINGILASIGILVPAFSYFTTFPPPFLYGSSVLTAAFAVATVIITYYYSPRARTGQRLPPLASLAMKVLIISVVLLILYLVLLRLCTVVTPENTARFQIGFDKFEWSLTDEGKKVKAKNPNATTQDWMLDDALFRSGGADVLWESWTIYLSGILIVIIFIFTFVLWTFGWALLAKQKAISS